MYLVLTRWQCPKKKWAQGGNHYETPGWSQSACITLLAFRLLSWYMGAEAPFRALSLVWWEDSYFSSSKYFPLVTCKTMYRHVCLPFNNLVRINIYTGRKPCVLLVLACAGEKKISSGGFSELIHKYIIITVVFQLIFSAKGEAFTSKCLHATNHGHSFWH